MRRLLPALVGLAFVSSVAIGADLSGAWTLNLDPDFSGFPDSVPCTFTQDGSKLTIRCGSGAPGTGEVEGQKVIFHIPTGARNHLSATFTGSLNDQMTTMVGVWRLVDDDGHAQEGKFDAKKQ